MAAYLRLLRNRPFALLWAGATVSMVGDALTWVSLVWLTVELGGSAFDIGILAVCYTAPVIVGGLAAGRPASCSPVAERPRWSPGSWPSSSVPPACWASPARPCRVAGPAPTRQARGRPPRRTRRCSAREREVSRAAASTPPR